MNGYQSSSNKNTRCEVCTQTISSRKNTLKNTIRTQYMCLEFLFKSKRYRRLPDAYTRPFDCSCDLCGSVFGDMQGLINHLGYHTTEEINTYIKRGYGTVRCGRCWSSFRSVSDMERHPCAQRRDSVIHGLSPIMSRSNSFDSVIVHEDSPV
jgi:hypothetical protein